MARRQGPNGSEVQRVVERRRSRKARSGESFCRRVVPPGAARSAGGPRTGSITVTPMNRHAVELSDIRDAARRIAGVAHRTPVLTSATLDALCGRRIFLKCENLQRVGAFKFRGAWNSVARLDDAGAARGVVTHSSGNHAQALALAARIRGIDAHIVMPDSAPPVKKRAVLGYGARVIDCAPTQEARESACARVVAETGGIEIPPYDYADTIAGQGTAALELLEEVPGLDAVMAPVGGGGLMSGTAIAARGLRPSVRVFGAEPAAAGDAARSLEAGRRIPLEAPPDTIADGLRTSIGLLTWPIIRDHVEEIHTVSDQDIVTAMRFVWERIKIVIEPSAAVPVAVVMSERFRRMPGLDSVGVILSGGNVDLDQLPWS